MSLEAITWVADLPLSTCNGTTFRVLMKLANRVDPLGYTAFESVTNIANALKCSDRTVQRALRDLMQLGLIREGDQRYVEHLDARYRPTVYDVLTPALKYIESRGDIRVGEPPSRGDRKGHPGVTTGVAHKPYLEPLNSTTPVSHFGNRARSEKSQ